MEVAKHNNVQSSKRVIVEWGRVLFHSDADVVGHPGEEGLAEHGILIDDQVSLSSPKPSQLADRFL